MKNVRLCRTLSLSYKPLVLIAMLVSLEVFLMQTATAQNPWLEDSRPLIDEGSQIKNSDNSWQGRSDSQSTDTIDESKYPPLEEDITLGTGVSGVSSPYDNSALSPSTVSSNMIQHSDFQPLGQIPVYPGGRQDNIVPYSAAAYPYANRYQPAYPSGGWPGSSMNQRPFGAGYGSGFPFGGNNGGGLPFWGSKGNGFPYGGNNSWMPFSNTGFR
jgi:hypothetical protein